MDTGFWDPGEVVTWRETWRGETWGANWPFPTGWEEWEPDPAWRAPI